MAFPRRNPDEDKFDRWATFGMGIACGVVPTMFVAWLVVFEYVI